MSPPCAHSQRTLTEEPFFLLLGIPPNRNFKPAIFFPFPFFFPSLEPLIFFRTPGPAETEDSFGTLRPAVPRSPPSRNRGSRGCWERTGEPFRYTSEHLQRSCRFTRLFCSSHVAFEDGHLPPKRQTLYSDTEPCCQSLPSPSSCHRRGAAPGSAAERCAFPGSAHLRCHQLPGPASPRVPQLGLRVWLGGSRIPRENQEESPGRDDGTKIHGRTTPLGCKNDAER